MTPSAGPDLAARTIHGVRLDQWAGICAAIAGGFPLSAALANDALDERAWRRAAPAWAAKLSREKPGAPLRAVFDRKLDEAESWLGRRVEPLEEDVESWLRFLGSWSSDAAPDALLARLKVRPADVSRIQKRWAARMEGDETLRKRVQKLAAKKPTGLPSIQVVPAELRPFPWSNKPPPPVSESPAEPAPAAPVDSPSLFDVPVVTPSFMLTPSLARAPLPSFLSVGVVQPFSGLLSPQSLPASSSPSSFTIGETALVFELPRGPVTPFSPPPPSVSTGASAQAAPKKPVSPPMGETMGAFELPRAPVMPFSATPAFEPPANRLPHGAERAKWLSAPIGQTVGVFELPARSLLPFRPAEEPVRPLNPTPAGPASQALRAPAPSKAAAAPIGETVVTFELPRSMILPFGNPGDRKSPDAAAPPAAPPPIAPPPSAAPPVAPPALTLEQHASLSAELALYPARLAETLVRYRVTPETKRLLDRRYAEMGAVRPEVHAAWERAYRTYYQWLLGQPRRQG